MLTAKQIRKAQRMLDQYSGYNPLYGSVRRWEPWSKKAMKWNQKTRQILKGD